MKRKASSAMGLLGFAIASVIAAVRGVDFEQAVYRAIVAATILAVVGYVVGFIAEKAVQEAVDQRAPLHKPSLEDIQQGTGAQQEGNK